VRRRRRIGDPAVDVNSLASGDFDQNGVNDVAVAADGGVAVFFGQAPPAGGLRSRPATLTVAGRRRVIAADLDHDSHLDVGVLNVDGYEYYPGNGAGQFGTAVPVASLPGKNFGAYYELLRHARQPRPPA
jgi:hypothetical protein